MGCSVLSWRQLERLKSHLGCLILTGAAQSSLGASWSDSNLTWAVQLSLEPLERLISYFNGLLGFTSSQLHGATQIPLGAAQFSLERPRSHLELLRYHLGCSIHTWSWTVGVTQISLGLPNSHLLRSHLSCSILTWSGSVLTWGQLGCLILTGAA